MEGNKNTVGKIRRRLAILHVLSILFLSCPVAVVLISRWDRYAPTVGSSVKLGVGSVTVLILIACFVLGKLKVSRYLSGVTVSFLICWCLESILADLVLILGCAAAGAFADWAILSWQIRKCEKELDRQKTTDAVGDRVEELLKAYTQKGGDGSA